MINVIKVKVNAKLINASTSPLLSRKKYDGFSADDNKDLRRVIGEVCRGSILIIPKKSTGIFFDTARGDIRDKIKRVEEDLDVYVIPMYALDDNKSLLIHRIISMKRIHKDAPIIIWCDETSETPFFEKFSDMFNIYMTTNISRIMYPAKGFGDRYRETDLSIETVVKDYSKL